MGEKPNTTIETEPTIEQPKPPAAEPQNTENQGAGEPGPVPYNRFKQLNDEAKNLKAQLDKLQKAQAEHERAAMSETDRLKAEKAELEARANEATATLTRFKMQEAFRRTAAALKVKFLDGAMDDAFALADLTGVQVEASGAVLGMEDVIKALIKAKPYLLERPEPGPIDASAGTGSGKAIPPNKAQKEAELKQRYNIR